MENKRVFRNAYKFGNKVFYSKEDVRYFIDNSERLVRDNQYYVVDVNPDLNEGNGYQNQIILGVSNLDENAVFAYLMMNYGNPISVVQGKPVKSYVVHKPEKYRCWSKVENKKVIYLDEMGNVCEYEKSVDRKMRQIISECDFM